MYKIGYFFEYSYSVQSNGTLIGKINLKNVVCATNWNFVDALLLIIDIF